MSAAAMASVRAPAGSQAQPAAHATVGSSRHTRGVAAAGVAAAGVRSSPHRGAVEVTGHRLVPRRGAVHEGAPPPVGARPSVVGAVGRRPAGGGAGRHRCDPAVQVQTRWKGAAASPHLPRVLLPLASGRGVGDGPDAGTCISPQFAPSEVMVSQAVFLSSGSTERELNRFARTSGQPTSLKKTRVPVGRAYPAKIVLSNAPPPPVNITDPPSHAWARPIYLGTGVCKVLPLNNPPHNLHTLPISPPPTRTHPKIYPLHPPPLTPPPLPLSPPHE